VYVSTAYCNCMAGHVILEHVYPSKCDPTYVMELVKDMMPEDIRDVTER